MLHTRIIRFDMMDTVALFRKKNSQTKTGLECAPVGSREKQWPHRLATKAYADLEF